MHTNNLEPRRFWRQPNFEHWGFDSEEHVEVASPCAACGTRSLMGAWRGLWFCTDCIERTSQANLDCDYDDLGVAG